MIWPFTEIKKLRAALAMANESTAQSVLNFTNMSRVIEGQKALIESVKSRAEYAASRACDLDAALIKACKELEIERMRVVACGVAAMANTRQSAQMQRCSKDSPYYCASVGDVHAASDREMQHREDLETALDRIADMVKGDDGQAWKEAEKFLNRHRSTKNCIKCGTEMIPMHGEDKKLCSNGACGHEIEWKLEEGQQYQYKRNVEAFVEDRSNQREDLEPPRSSLERL